MVRPGKVPAGTPLTETELIVLEGLARGDTVGAVAKRIDRAANTVKSHALNIKARTGTHSIGAALAVAVARGEIVIPMEPGEELPERQQQILIGFAQGLSTDKIAQKLGVSVQTVKNDTTAMYRKLNGVSRPHLVYLGLKTGNLTVNRRKKK